jgi:UDP-N-acetylmuramoylalanine--D-glutamate ligase
MTPISIFAGQTVAVFGLARSGIVSAEALRAGGAHVACWDDSVAGRAAAQSAGLPLVDLTVADWSGFAALVLAPGVPLTHPVPHWTVAKARSNGVEIIGDVELFFRERAKIAPAAPVIAITGTNGKSTTTALIAHVLRACGRDVQMGGNIGVGVLALAPPALNRVHVLELSSFQIDLTPSLKPSVGVLLNITPDHLDRHGTLDLYAAIKTRLVLAADHAVVSVDDALCRAAVAAVDAKARPLTRISDRPVADIYAESGRLHRRTNAGVFEAVANLSGIRSLRGDHNAQNAAAAIAAVTQVGLAVDAAAAALATFPGLAHRMEEIGRIGRAVLINDSKATNADSAEKALASFPGDIFWIVGGVQKEGGIAPLAAYFKRVAKAYLIGQSSAAFAATLGDQCRHQVCGTLEAALSAALTDAAALAGAEPVVLLSPACASYDQYKSFEHRGDHFRDLALAMPGFTPRA